MGGIFNNFLKLKIQLSIGKLSILDITFSTLCDHLSTGEIAHPIILTANRRQSRALKHSPQLSPHIGQTTIVPLSAWVQQLWEEALLQSVPGCERRIMETAEVRVIWDSLVKRHPDTPALIDAKDLGRQLQQAQDLIDLYLVGEQELAESDLEETRYLLDQRTRFINEASVRACLTHNMALSQLCEPETLNALQELITQRPVFCFGFTELVPLHQQFLNCWHPGWQGLKHDETSRSVKLVSAKTLEENYTAAAQWAKRALEDYPDTARVAVVVPQLSRDLKQVKETFAHILEPNQWLQHEGKLISRVFDSSAGETLLDQPIVQSIFLLLALRTHRIDRNSAEALLLSPFWRQGHSPLHTHALTFVRKSARDDISTSFLLELCSQNDVKDATLLSLRQALRRLPATLSVSEWIEQLIPLLHSAGWPGPHVIDSFEYQVVQSLFATLDAFTVLDDCLGQLTLHEFLQEFKLYAANTAFHEEVKAPRIRILGLMEASGIEWDACFVCDLSEHTLPQPLAPHPLLPLELQKKRGLPKTSHEKELRYARDMLASLIHHSADCTLSYPERADDQDLQPSPLLSELLAHHPQQRENPIPSDIDIWLTRCMQETRFASQAPGAAPVIERGETLLGGAYHLDAFWTNPMLAFFRFRLQIATQERDALGLSPQHRGAVLHETLADIYSAYPDSDRLRSWRQSSDFELLLNQRITEHFSAYKARLPALVYEFERQRCIETLRQFIDEDVQRGDAFSVFELEQSHDIELAGRHLKVRVDRIDRIGEALFLIDYKSGNTSVSGLVSTPLQDFQLPVYSLCCDPHRLAGVAYVELNHSDRCFNGISGVPLNIPGIQVAHKVRQSTLTEEWQSTLSLWRQQLEAHATELCEGRADYLCRHQARQAYLSDLMPAVRQEEVQP